MTQGWNGAMFIVDMGEKQPAGQIKGATLDERDFLLKSNNLSEIPNRNTARKNLGITVSANPPIAPKVNDLWLDLNSDISFT